MTAVLGTFVDVKTVRTRSVMQLVIEIPIEGADAALKALGGVPQPAIERWVGIALSPKERKARGDCHCGKDGHALNSINCPVHGTAKKEKRAWESLSPTEQAGIRCGEKNFADFATLQFGGPIAPEELVRQICGVVSRADLNKFPGPAAKWAKIESQYQQFLTDKRYESSRMR